MGDIEEGYLVKYKALFVEFFRVKVEGYVESVF